MDIFYYNTPIYREILLQFLQFTEKYYINRTPFHFRRRAEAVLRRVARLSKAFSTDRPSSPEKCQYVDLSRAIWKSSGTSQHSTTSKIGLRGIARYAEKASAVGFLLIWNAVLRRGSGGGVFSWICGICGITCIVEHKRLLLIFYLGYAGPGVSKVFFTWCFLLLLFASDDIKYFALKSKQTQNVSFNFL